MPGGRLGPNYGQTHRGIEDPGSTGFGLHYNGQNNGLSEKPTSPLYEGFCLPEGKVGYMDVRNKQKGACSPLPIGAQGPFQSPLTHTNTPPYIDMAVAANGAHT